MPIGFRVITGHSRAGQDMVDAFGALPTAIISDNMSRMFAGGARLRPLHKSGSLAGTALTVRTRPGDNLMIHKAVDMAEAGDVIVVDGGGDLTSALIGELIIRHAMSRGIKGFIIDAAARDVDFIAAGSFPVYAAGVSHRGPYKDGPGEINVPIALDGMIVEPGDIIVGDLDGVLAIPQRDCAGLLEAARAQAVGEQKTLNAIAGDGWDRAWVDETLRAKGCEGV